MNCNVMGSIVGQIARTRPRFQAPYLLEFECENFGDGFLDITTFDGAEWLEVVCTDARHPDVREVLSTAILRSRANQAQGQSAAITARLRAALEGSAKPARDPTRKRPGTDRGKASRRMK